MMKAIFFSTSHESISSVYPDYLKKRLENSVELVGEMNDFSHDSFENNKKVLADVDFILSTWGMPHLSVETIKEYLPSVKAVFYGAGTVQSFAREFLSLGIKVISAWAANGVPVAEFTVSQIMLSAKGYFQRSVLSSKENWQNRSDGGCFPGMYRTKIGIIGCGMIGSLVCRMLKAYNCDIYVYDKYMSAEKAEQSGVTLTSLEEIFSSCFVISNHLANNPQTVGMLDYKLFSLMQPNATFINTGRGATVIEADLIKMLKEKPSAVALLDVTNPEPPEKNSELYTLPNCMLSPHIAGSIGNEVERMGEYMCSELEKYLHGDALLYEVSMQMLEIMA